MNNLKINNKLFNKNINFARVGLLPIDPLTIPSLQHFLKSNLSTDSDIGSWVVSGTNILNGNDKGSAGLLFSTSGSAIYFVYGNCKPFSAGASHNGNIWVTGTMMHNINSFSIVCAFKNTVVTGVVKSLFRTWGNASTYINIQLDVTGKLKFYVVDNLGNVILTSVNTYLDNNWHVAAFIWDATNKTSNVYIEGEHLTGQNLLMNNVNTWWDVTQRQVVGCNVLFHGATSQQWEQQWSDFQVYNTNLDLNTINGLKLYLCNRLNLSFSPFI